ncbi:unnamed protein product [Rhodiola kirilowii]
MAALKAAYVSDLPHLDMVPENTIYSARFPPQGWSSSFRAPKFLVIGHRGNGMNLLQSSDPRMKAFKENSILSFNAAAQFPIDFIEFDVQVTKDDWAVIFHDNFILTTDAQESIVEKRLTELCLSEFLEYGPQRNPTQLGKSLLRKTKDGKIFNWNVEVDHPACTLQEAFQQVKPTTIGFNIELKFDDHILYQHEYLVHFIQIVLQVVFEHANDRPIIFSTFQPDAALLIRKMQNKYPVFFLTNAGGEIFEDSRRNSLEAAINLCLEGGLQGIVSEAKGLFRNPGAVPKIKEAKLALLTYGKLNNVPEAVYMQHLFGVEGVIVDLVKEITEAVHSMIKPQFSEREISFLLKLIPELIQQ